MGSGRGGIKGEEEGETPVIEVHLRDGVETS